MPRAEVVAMQFDIAGHSKIDVPERTLLEVRARLERYVHALITAAGAKDLQWQGDGGWCYFLADEALVFEDVCDAGLDVLHCLSRVNDWCHRTGRLHKPLSLRISIDSMNAELDSNIGHVASRHMNVFLKHERNVGLANALVVTDRIYQQLPARLRERFDKWKSVEQIGLVYAYEGKQRRLDQLKNLRRHWNDQETVSDDHPQILEVTAFAGERYVDIAREAYQDVDSELGVTANSDDDFGAIGSAGFLIFRNALVNELFNAHQDTTVRIDIRELADDPYANRNPSITSQALARATLALNGEISYAGGETIRFCAPDAIGFKYAIGDSTELDCVAAGKLRIDGVIAGLTTGEAPENSNS